MRTAGVVVAVAALVLAGGESARAQTVREPAGRSEIAIGILWTGTASQGAVDATLTGPTGDRVRLFSTSTEMAGTPGIEVRFGRRITRFVQAEVTASYSRPDMKTSITGDVENGASTTATESLRQLVLLGGAVVSLPRWQIGARLRPFAAGGGGYLRQLHEGDTLAQSGQVYYAGGGATIRLTERGRTRRLKELGVRVDARALFRSGAVTLDGRVHAAPAVAASLFARF